MNLYDRANFLLCRVWRVRPWELRQAIARDEILGCEVETVMQGARFTEHEPVVRFVRPDVYQREQLERDMAKTRAAAMGIFANAKRRQSDNGETQ